VGEKMNKKSISVLLSMLLFSSILPISFIQEGNTQATLTKSILNFSDNTPPLIYDEDPENGATNVSILPLLTVTVDDAEGDIVTAYWFSNATGSSELFGVNESINTSSGPVSIVQINQNFSDYATTYWWSIHAFDAINWTNVTFSFTTQEEPNFPPTQPILIAGPSAGGPNITLEFSAVSSDPNTDDIFYKWDWGDGNITEWLGPVPSGEIVTENHSWDEEGAFMIRVKAKDIFNCESSWSEAFNITIAPQIKINNIFPGFIYLRLLSFNRSYAYIYLLEALGISVVISDEGLAVEACASGIVSTVEFEAHNLIWDDYIVDEDTNGSNGFNSLFAIDTGLWELTVYAYDSDGNMIDSDTIEYLVFLSMSSGERSLIRRGLLRHRFHTRLVGT
jgi:hypothetical protein